MSTTTIIEDNSDKVILDASALIALLLKEPGSDIIKKLLTKAIMSSVNVVEVAKFLLEKEMFDTQQVRLLLQQLLYEIVPFDTYQCFTNAELILKTKQYGLSLGDRACVGLGIITDYPIYTTDRIWAKLAIDNLNIIIIR